MLQLWTVATELIKLASFSPFVRPISLPGNRQACPLCLFSLLFVCSPPDRKGLLDFMLESVFAMLLHHAPTEYPARAARQWIPPSIPPKQLASGSRRVSRQSGSPVDPAEYPAAGQWIPPSIPPELLASGSRRVSRQSGSPVDPAKYPTRAARQWIPPSIPPQPASESSWPVGSPVDPAEYPTRAAPPSIPPEQPPVDPAVLSILCRWILPSIRPASSRSGSPSFASGFCQYPAKAACQSGFA